MGLGMGRTNRNLGRATQAGVTSDVVDRIVNTVPRLAQSEHGRVCVALALVVDEVLDSVLYGEVVSHGIWVTFHRDLVLVVTCRQPQREKRNATRRERDIYIDLIIRSMDIYHQTPHT